MSPTSKKFIVLLSTHVSNAILTVILIYVSLLITSLPLAEHQATKVKSAIGVLKEKGFEREAFVLENFAFFRSSDNWLNYITEKENSFAATNMPFGIITLYPDFYSRTADDTERAMILLHEARHMMAENENQAYKYVWKHRDKLGWTQLSHGSTEVYTTVELQTRENAPEIFNCPDKLWSDCTEQLIGKK